MSKGFGEFVRAEMNRLGQTHKDLGGTIHDELDGGERSTVTTKLSKLLNGSPEGERYFFDDGHPARLSALAKSLGHTAEGLRAELARHSSVRTLVLDPRLPVDLVAEIEQSCVNESSLKVHRAPEAADVRPVLRDHARGAENPIIVTSDASDLEMFVLLNIESTLVERVPHGVRLNSYPDLISVPGPRAPTLFDDSGAPLVPIHRR